MENQKKKHHAKRKNLETPCSGAVSTSTISAIFTVFLFMLLPVCHRW